MSRSKIDVWGSTWGGPWGDGTPKLCENNCLLNIYWYQKKVELWLEPFKKLILGVHLGESPGGWHPQTTLKYLSVKYLLISKKSSTVAWAVQKMDFWRPHLGGFPMELPQEFREKKLRLQLNNFTQNLDFDVLWFKRRRVYKISEEKKGKEKK